LKFQIKTLGNRLAAMLNRLTIISAAGYYANIAIISDLIDTDRYSSFEKIESIARKKAPPCGSGAPLPMKKEPSAHRPRHLEFQPSFLIIAMPSNSSPIILTAERCTQPEFRSGWTMTI